MNLAYFSKEFNKPFVNFWRVWTKISNCWELLRKVWKFLMKILLKNWIFIYFYLFFYYIFGKFVTKNRAFGNNTSFLQQFFWFRRGEFSPFPRWLRPWVWLYLIKTCSEHSTYTLLYFSRGFSLFQFKNIQIYYVNSFKG